MNKGRQVSHPAKQPSQQDTTNRLLQAVALHQQGRTEEAELLYRQVLSRTPNNFDALHLLGLIAAQNGSHEEAVRLLTQALRINSRSTSALYSLGVSLQLLNRLAEAVASYDKALATKPDHAEALSNRGNALNEMQRYEESLKSCGQALAIKPDYPEALINQGNALQRLHRHAEALASFDKALAIRPDDAEALYNRGNCLQGLDRHEEALVSYERALAVRPDYAEAFCNRGNSLQFLRRHEEALACYERAQALKPDYVEAHLNEGLCRLLMGDYPRGLEQYEWRLKQEAFVKGQRRFDRPLWLGKEPLAGRKILIHVEQGLGDTIQLCRYAKVLSDLGAIVLLEVPSSLKSLFAGLDGVDLLLTQGEPLPEFDYHCPIMSLPLALGTRVETIPGKVPYLAAPEQSLRHWEGKLGRSVKPRIGLAWSGNSAHINDLNRSIPLQRLLPLLTNDFEFVSLQRDVRAADQKILDEGAGIVHFGNSLTDFSDTAALVQSMDIVISVDTSIAHLAGAMGKSVWILLPFAPDWRWLLDRDDSPWYPSAKLLRQARPGDWGNVITAVRAQLDRISHGV